MHVTAIIAAGGRGRRFGGAEPKQLLSVGGMPILARSVEAFASHPSVDAVIVALPPELADDPPAYHRSAKALAPPGAGASALHGTGKPGKPLWIVAGGARRQDSIANAFNAAGTTTDVIVIHDAARPFASADLIARTIAAAAESGAAVAAVQSRDTVKRTDRAPAISGRTVIETIPRDTIYLAQTPQAFKREVLRRALDNNATLRFETPLPVNADNFRRLAPAFNHVESAFRVRSSDAGLVCDGIDSMQWGVPPLGRPEFWTNSGHTPGIRIRVDGPGEVLASEGLLNMRLRSGKLADLVDIGHSGHWDAWRRNATDAVVADLNRRQIPNIEKFFGGLQGVNTLLCHIINRVLDRVVNARHGGTVVILPQSAAQVISLKWPILDLSIRTVSANFWEASARASSAESDLRRHSLLQLRLQHVVRSIAALTRIDGCVVLTPELDVLGAGGEIRVADTDVERSGLIFTDIGKNMPWPDQSGTDLGGTRHRSAFRLCMAVPHTLAFVVSQDGEVTLMCSSDTEMRCVRGLTADPWAA